MKAKPSRLRLAFMIQNRNNRNKAVIGDKKNTVEP
jgi:hypothetical protein